MEIAEVIDCVYDGSEGLKYINQHCLEGAIEQQAAPDLVFLDNHMPNIDGFEFLEVLEKIEVDRSRLHIVMLTTSENIKDTQRAATFGKKLHSYITKPLKPIQVKQVLSTIPLF